MIFYFFIYALCWWMVFYMMLPWGNRAPDRVEPGHAPSSPERPRLKLKVLLTSLLALPVSWALHKALVSDWLMLYIQPL